jgi:exodeoxyribonuclease V gamma subunit
VLHLHRADRADRLIGALAEVLAVPLDDPFAVEIIAVPTRGVERWVTQQLSGALGAAAGRSDGVCANVAFPSPRHLIDETVAIASGFAAEDDPWVPGRAVWPLLEVLDTHLDEPWLGRVAEHLSRGRGDRSRRLRTAQHFAGLYDRYALYRPEMLESWREGVDDDGSGATLPEHERWQAELWRRLRGQVALPGPAERLAAACERLLAEPELAPLPPRLVLFGLTNLPARHLVVLRALADARDVHLFLLQPSHVVWNDVAYELDRRGTQRARGEVSAALLPANPLLASWGRDARELQMVLSQAGVAGAGDRHYANGDDPASALLGQVQDDVRADRAPGDGGQVPLLDPSDLSLQIHACHGAGRQVEVLRDAILHALQDDPTLEPRDVIVMCPDIETFAPLIEATFGAGEDLEARLDATNDLGDARVSAGPALRVRLADRALRETNPVLGVVARLLELTTARVTASEVLDLADREPVRRRFRFTQDDLTRLAEWVAATGARWGFDAEHRKTYKMGQIAQGTWEAGLDRLLTGVAWTEEAPGLLSGVLPYDDVDSAAIDVAGRFAEYLDRLQAAVTALSTTQPIGDWVASIADATDALTALSPRDAWQRAELQRILVDVLDEATLDGVIATTSLDAADVAALLEERLAGRPTRANFRTGHLTVCTLQPMRSVPHRVVCLLGLDDAVFPRRSARDGDDLLLDAPHVGDRDARSEDRQILLDALMAATDRLIITYTGSDERTNATRSPAVPVGELLDVVDRTARVGEAGGTVRDHIVVRHPLQPFDTRNFAPGALVPAKSWSFDAITLAGARALVAPRTPRPPFLAGPLPELEHELIAIEQLVAFLGRPVRAFLAQRLGVGTGVPNEEIDDALPVELDGLASWAVGHRLLQARLGGAGTAAAVATERARGALPPGEIGEKVLGRIEPIVDELLTAAFSSIELDQERHSVDVRLTLDDGRRIGGTISGLVGDTVQVVTYARVNARQRLGAWAHMLALTAAFPERPFSALTVGRARRRAANHRAIVTVARIGALAGSAEERRALALAQLTTLVDLYDRGMREPLPLYCETSAAFAAAGNDQLAVRQAREAWTSGFQQPREDRDDEHVLVLGADRLFDDLLAERPRDDESGPGWSADTQPTRLGRYAHRLWDGLLAAEVVTDR